jgi:hypothetical protein
MSEFGRNIALSNDWLLTVYKKYYNSAPLGYGVQAYRKRENQWVDAGSWSATESGVYRVQDVAISRTVAVLGAGAPYASQLSNYPDNGSAYLLNLKKAFSWPIFIPAITDMSRQHGQQ